MNDRTSELALPVGIVLIGIANLVNLLVADTDLVRFFAGVLLGLGIGAEVFAIYALASRRSG